MSEMKRLPLIITAIVVLTLASSCRLVLYKVYYNAKLIPNWASEKRINKFYDRHAVSNDDFIMLSTSNLIKKLEEPGWGFENWDLFNSSGYRVRRKGDSLSCIASDYTFLQNISKGGYTVDTAFHIANDTIINDHLSADYPYSTYKDYDYTLVLYWSSWRGRYSKNILKLEKALVLNNPHLRLRVVKVNMDFRKEMKDTGMDKIQLLIDEQQSTRPPSG